MAMGQMQHSMTGNPNMGSSNMGGTLGMGDPTGVGLGLGTRYPPSAAPPGAPGTAMGTAMPFATSPLTPNGMYGMQAGSGARPLAPQLPGAPAASSAPPSAGYAPSGDLLAMLNKQQGGSHGAGVHALSMASSSSMGAPHTISGVNADSPGQPPHGNMHGALGGHGAAPSGLSFDMNSDFPALGGRMANLSMGNDLDAPGRFGLSDGIRESDFAMQATRVHGSQKNEDFPALPSGTGPAGLVGAAVGAGGGSVASPLIPAPPGTFQNVDQASVVPSVNGDHSRQGLSSLGLGLGNNSSTSKPASQNFGATMGAHGHQEVAPAGAGGLSFGGAVVTPSGVMGAGNTGAGTAPGRPAFSSLVGQQPGGGKIVGDGNGDKRSEQFGLLGLLNVIRMTDPDLNTLALGSDLTTLGLNLNSSECLYSTFASPWAEGPTTREPQFSLPLCYYMQPPPLKTSHLSKFQLETLFYIFYAMPKDVLQAYAAQELYNREWQYHRELKLWFKRGTPADGLSVTNGQYIYFDINSWECRMFSNVHAANLATGLLSEEEVRVKFAPSG